MKEQQVSKHLLANGARVVVDANSRFRSAAYAICLLGGVRDEQPEQAGVTHLLEHLLFKRTAKKNTKELAQVIDDLGGRINAFTDTDSLCLYGSVPAENLGELQDFFAELILHSAFNENDLKVEKEVVRQEILEAADDPHDVISRRFCKRLWPNHLLSMPAFGALETVEKITLDQLYERLENIRQGARMIIAASGAVDEKAVLAHATRAYSKLEIGTQPRIESPRTAGGIDTVVQPIQQVYFSWGVPWLENRDERFLCGEVLSAVLGEGMSSRLFQRIREDEGLSYDISSGVESYPGASVFAVSAVVERGSLPQTLNIVHEEFKRLCLAGISDAERVRAIASLRAQLLMEADSLADRLWRAIDSEVIYGRHHAAAEEIAKLQTITTGEVKQVAEEFLKPENYLLVLGGDVDNFQLEGPLADILSPCDT